MSKPAASRTLAVKTPGAASTELTPEQRAAHAAELQEQEAALDAELLAGGDTEGDVGDPVARTAFENAPDLAAFIQAEVAKGVRQALAVHQRATTVHGAPPAELPDQADVDPFAIRSEVLTKQGWVTPVVYPGQVDPTKRG